MEQEDIANGAQAPDSDAPEAAPDSMLHLSVPEPFDLAPGAVIGIDVRDGWIIPPPARG